MTPRNFYYPVVMSIREVAESVIGVVEMYGISEHQISIIETMRLMLADYFYGEEAVTANPFVEVNGRRLVFEHQNSFTGSDGFLQAMMNDVNNVFWLLSDLIGMQALTQTAEYQHRPTDCFYSFHDQEMRITVYVPVFNELEQKPNIAPVPISAVLISCMRTLPANIRALMANEPMLNPTSFGAGEY